MEFEYTGSLYVDEKDLEEMVSLCKSGEYSPYYAAREVAKGWDDDEAALFYLISDDLEEEIKRRLKEE